MKKILFSILVLAGITATAQVKVGTNPTTINSSALFELESIQKGFLPPRMTTAERTAIASPAKGLVMYNTTKDCLEINQGTPAAPAWECIGASVTPSVAANCTTAGFNAGTYVSGVALSGRTYSVTLTNNSFASATIAFSTADLTLSDPSLIVGTPTGSPALSGGNATLASGASVVITYPITGTPSACGTLSGTWTKLSLNCTKTVVVNPNINCVTGSWTTAITPSAPAGLINGIAYSGTYSIPYTGGSCTLPAESITQSGLTLSYAGGSIGATGSISFNLSGTYTGTTGFVSFTTSSGCTVIAGTLLKSCNEIKVALPSSTTGIYWIDPDGTAGSAYSPMQAYCDMSTDGGGWTLVGQYNHQAVDITAFSRTTLPNRGSDTIGDESSSTGEFGLWGLAEQTLLATIPFSGYRVESYTSSNGFHIKVDSASYVTLGNVSGSGTITNLGQPAYWPASVTTFYNASSCGFINGRPLRQGGSDCFYHANFGCSAGSFLISRVAPGSNQTMEGISTGAKTTGIGRLWVK